MKVISSLDDVKSFINDHKSDETISLIPTMGNIHPGHLKLINSASSSSLKIVSIYIKKGVITTQVGSQDKKPLQVENWLNVFNHHFGNTNLSRVYIPSFDCSWNFSSSINH